MLNDYNDCDFVKYASNLTYFSHAYLFETNNMNQAYPIVKSFAKKILCVHHYNECKKNNCNICTLIDNNLYDDFYVLNSESINIKVPEISELLERFSTKSLKENGNRVYLICNAERMLESVQNKLLKFIEEPPDNVYAIFITKNKKKILSTLKSRCQLITLNFSEKISEFDYQCINDFLCDIVNLKVRTLAYSGKHFKNIIKNRVEMVNYFDNMEHFLSNLLLYKYNRNKDFNFTVNDIILNIPSETILYYLNITSNLKQLVKKNINLNLLVDRYIIELTREVDVCIK